LKSGVLFQLLPLALDWELLVRCATLLLSWINAGVERENLIRAELDLEWIRLYKDYKPER
jgi:hypothetical protein